MKSEIETRGIIDVSMLHHMWDQGAKRRAEQFHAIFLIIHPLYKVLADEFDFLCEIAEILLEMEVDNG